MLISKKGEGGGGPPMWIYFFFFFIILLYNNVMWLLVEGGRSNKVDTFLFVFLLSTMPLDQNIMVKIGAVRSCYFDFLQDPTLLKFLPK